MKCLLLGYDANGKPLFLEPEDSDAHIQVVGPSGSGKSKFLKSLMCEHLKNDHGFALFDRRGSLYNDVLAFAEQHGLEQNIVRLNVSCRENEVSFNPFQLKPNMDVNSQVERRISATLQAWSMETADHAPMFTRILRLVYTVMMKQNLAPPQILALLDFDGHPIREWLLERLNSPLIRNEWRELQRMNAESWRDATLSLKNRLVRFFNAQTIWGSFGMLGRSISVHEIMDQGKILLVNFAASCDLSNENARLFEALLVNEFFESAPLRTHDDSGHCPEPYHLFLDEFQSVASAEISRMLAQGRKSALFLTLGHQSFSQLDREIIESLLANCRIKVVFGALPTESARIMAEELFKFGKNEQACKGNPHATGYMTSHGSNSGDAHGESWGHLESETKVPSYLPKPFQEFFSAPFHSKQEQLEKIAIALEVGTPNHCFIKIHDQQTQAMQIRITPPIAAMVTGRKQSESYIGQQHPYPSANPTAEVDHLLEQEETALLQEVIPVVPRLQLRRMRLPKPSGSRAKITRVLRAYGDSWTIDENLTLICDKLDRLRIPVPKSWGTRHVRPARTWSRAFRHYPHLVVQAIRIRCEGHGEVS